MTPSHPRAGRQPLELEGVITDILVAVDDEYEKVLGEPIRLDGPDVDALRDAVERELRHAVPAYADDAAEARQGEGHNHESSSKDTTPNA